LWTATEQFRANGPEFVSAVLKSWAAEQQIELDFTTPGKLTENGHIESFSGLCSPIFANLYLDRLDQFVKTELLRRYNRGKRRRPNLAYKNTDNAIARAKRRGNREAVHELRKQRRAVLSQDPTDQDFRRLRYLRYAADFLPGFSGPKVEAEEIKRQIGEFLEKTVKLELSEENTLITHAQTGVAHFLGYDLVAQHADDKLDWRGQRQVNGMVALRVPEAVIAKKCSLYMCNGKPAQRPQMLHDTDSTIVSRYQAEYRGLVQYYLLAQNVFRLGKLHWVMQASLLKKLAGMHRSSVQKMARKHKATTDTAYEPRTCLRVVIECSEGKKPLVAQFGGIPLKRQQNAILVDNTPTIYTARQNEVVRRLVAGGRELCGDSGQVEVHHIRKLADLRKEGRREKPASVKLMAPTQAARRVPTMPRRYSRRTL
jgi:hypothetical protein